MSARKYNLSRIVYDAQWIIEVFNDLPPGSERDKLEVEILRLRRSVREAVWRATLARDAVNAAEPSEWEEIDDCREPSHPEDYADPDAEPKSPAEASDSPESDSPPASVSPPPSFDVDEIPF